MKLVGNEHFEHDTNESKIEIFPFPVKCINWRGCNIYLECEKGSKYLIDKEHFIHDTKKSVINDIFLLLRKSFGEEVVAFSQRDKKCNELLVNQRIFRD